MLMFEWTSLPSYKWWNLLRYLVMILMNHPCGFLHAIKYVFFRLMAEWFGFGGWMICVSLCLIRHSAVAFLALINVVPGLGVSLRNTMWFLVFHILHNSATNLSILRACPTTLAALRICNRPICGLKRRFVLTQLWEAASLQQFYKILHPKNKWFVSSISDWPKGQRESTSYLFEPRFL